MMKNVQNNNYKQNLPHKSLMQLFTFPPTEINSSPNSFVSIVNSGSRKKTLTVKTQTVTRKKWLKKMTCENFRSQPTKKQTVEKSPIRVRQYNPNHMQSIMLSNQTFYFLFFISFNVTSFCFLSLLDRSIFFSSPQSFISSSK